VISNKQDVLDRGYAKTLEEWWFLLEDGWPTVSAIIQSHLPKDLGSAQQAKEGGDAVGLWLVLSRTWEALPDASYIHSIPGFIRLCDLCSDFPSEK